MGDMALVSIFPPCPTCSGEVTDLIAEGRVEDRRFGSLETTVMPAREPFKLVPCGHEVRDFVTGPGPGVRRWGKQ